MTTQADPTTRDALLALLDSRFPAQAVTVPGGASVTVRTAGADDAPVVVLLHGIGSGAASWLRCAVALAGRARVVAWDAPGYGDSTALASATPSARDYAERLADLLAAMRVERCVLVGHSLGALMGAACAYGRGRSVVRHLLLVSPARGYGGAEAATRAQTRATRLSTLRELGIAGIARQAPGRMLSAAADAAARDWVQWNAARLVPAGYAQAVEMLCSDDIERYADLPMPVEVHVGDADVVTPPEACRRVAERYHAPFALIEGAGHASPIEQPERVACLIAEAVARQEENA